MKRSILLLLFVSCIVATTLVSQAAVVSRPVAMAGRAILPVTLIVTTNSSAINLLTASVYVVQENAGAPVSVSQQSGNGNGPGFLFLRAGNFRLEVGAKLHLEIHVNGTTYVSPSYTVSSTDVSSNSVYLTYTVI
jgi:hypothetical protein